MHFTGRLLRRGGPSSRVASTRRSFSVARIWVAIYARRARAVARDPELPAAHVCRPAAVYGGWLYLVFGLTQHAGLAEDVLDHRLNSRTVYMNPVLAVPLLEHELPRRAPHVPDGALSCPAGAA